MKLVAIILTYNEELHIERVLSSVTNITKDIYVIDSGSTDETLTIARSFGVHVLVHPFVNQSQQFNWALGNIAQCFDWVFRIDADECIDEKLIFDIKNELPNLPNDINGVYINRSIQFQGQLIRYGGIFPMKVLRIFRLGKGNCENRWMDEHIKVLGKTTSFQGQIVDDNLNSLTWWIEKHNRYANREAVELLNLVYEFMPRDTLSGLSSNSKASRKRWLKEHVYFQLPSGFRAVMYFFYRYVFRLGFLDGRSGLSFHFLQGLWYRYLVDAKVDEIKRFMSINQVDAPTAIERLFGINVYL